MQVSIYPGMPGRIGQRKIQIEIYDNVCNNGNLTLVPDPSQHTNIDTIMSTMFNKTQNDNKFTYELKPDLAISNVYINKIKLIATDPTTGATKDVWIWVVKDQSFTVSFDSGTGGSAVADQIVASGGKATKPADPTNSDTTLGLCGWYTSSDGGATLSATQYDFDNTTVTADITLYAKWGAISFSGSAAEFLATSFVPGNDATTPYTVTINSATADQLKTIAKAIGKISDSHFKGVYINLDLSGCGVTSIPNDAFNASNSYGGVWLNTYLTGVILPSGLQTVGLSAFYGCTNLKTIIGSNSITWIKDQAFAGTGISSIPTANWSAMLYTSTGIFAGCLGLQNITVPAYLARQMQTFRGCTNLASVTIEDGTTEIDRNVFDGCTSLKTLTIPASVDTILYTAFKGCTGLTAADANITVGGTNSWKIYHSSDFSVAPDQTGVAFPNPSYEEENWHRGN